MTASEVSFDVLSLGVVLLLAAMGGCFKAASFRGDFNDKWRRRVVVAESGLAEQAARQLRTLHAEIGQRLVQKGGFDPSKATADPSELIESVETFLALMKIKIQLQRRLDFLLITGPVFFGGLLLFGIAVIPVFGHLSNIWNNHPWFEYGLYLGAVALFILFLTFGYYVILQHRLSDAEIKSMVTGE